MRSAGLGALLQPPKLDADANLALEVWHWLGGWNPQALPVAMEWFNVRDPERLVADLLLIRDEVNKR